MRAFVVSCLCLTLAAAACNKAPEQRSFTLQGQIQSLEPARKTVVVKHEEIKGFMPAMTMPYEVEEAKWLGEVPPRGLLDATPVVFSNRPRLARIRKVGAAPLEKPADSAAMPTASSGFELLRPGETV